MGGVGSIIPNMVAKKVIHSLLIRNNLIFPSEESSIHHGGYLILDDFK